MEILDPFLRENMIDIYIKTDRHYYYDVSKTGNSVAFVLAEDFYLIISNLITRPTFLT